MKSEPVMVEIENFFSEEKPTVETISKTFNLAAGKLRDEGPVPMYGNGHKAAPTSYIVFTDRETGEEMQRQKPALVKVWDDPQFGPA